jgi:hypothetical protein
MEKYSILDASNDFADLSNDIGRFKKILCKEKNIDLKSQDFRLVTLDSIQQYLLSLTAYIRPFVKLQEILTKEDFLKVLNLGVSEEQLDGKGAGLIYIFPIRSLVVMVHFVVDSYLKETGFEGGFYTKVENVFSGFDSGLVEEYKNDLHCLGFFRNSFHNKGVHSNDNKVFNCEGMKIEFKKGEVIIYNWKTVYLLIKSATEALKFIILNKD